MKLLRLSFRQMLRNGVSPPNLMIRGFAAAGNFESESNKVTEKGVEPNLVSFNAVIQGLCEKKRMEEAEKVAEEMNRKGFAIDESTYNTLLGGMCEINDWTRASELYDEMRVKRLSVNERNYKSLIDLLCEDVILDKAYQVLGEMIDTGFSPSVATYHLLIRLYLYYDERLDEALEILRGMTERGLTPDTAIYHSLLGFLCSRKRRRLSEAHDLFRDMLRRGVSPDGVTYFTLLYAYCDEGQFAKAFHMHYEMLHKGFLPDFVTWFSPSFVTCNALIHGLCFLGRADEALEILRDMPEMGLSPDAVCYATAISGFCRNRELRKAYHLKVELYENKDIGEMDEFEYKSLMQGLSDEDTYSSLMNDYLAEGNLERASNLDDDMRRYGSLPASVTFCVFFNGLNKKSRTREAKRMLLDMIYDAPSYNLYDTLIENCSNNEFKSVVGLVKGFITRGLVNEAARAHDTMLEGNYKPDGAVYNLLIFDLSRVPNINVHTFKKKRSLNVRKAYNMYTEMVHYGFVPHMFSVLALIEALHYDGRHNEMEWVIQNTLRSCNLNDSELLKVLNEIDIRVDIRECVIHSLKNVLAELAMDGLLLDGGKCSYASAST